MKITLYYKKDRGQIVKIKDSNKMTSLLISANFQEIVTKFNNFNQLKSPTVPLLLLNDEQWRDVKKELNTKDEILAVYLNSSKRLFFHITNSALYQQALNRESQETRDVVEFKGDQFLINN